MIKKGFPREKINLANPLAGDPAMVVNVSKYISSKELGGAAVYVTLDDNKLDIGSNPIITAVRETLNQSSST